ncbi:MAG: PAS domain-containing sensor histidine kinase [Prolixibacteraceae bacterium]|nr:PAS domain-containing sensor histidine kinase [Prolixibacteraceae bacterium]
MDTDRKKEKDSNPECPQYVDIFRQSPIAIELYDSNGNFNDCNQACLDLFGIENIDAVKNVNLFLNHHLPAQGIADIKSGKIFRYEIEYDFDLITRKKYYKTTKKGICFIECFIKPTIDNEKRTTGYTVHITDISERKKAEVALLKSEEKFRSLIQYSSDPIFSFNPDDTYRFVNEAFAFHFGKKPEDIIGKTPYDIFTYNEAKGRLALVHQVFQSGEKGEIEVKVVDQSGKTNYFLTMVDPVKNEKKEVLYVTCVSKNITKRRTIEEALKVSEEKFRRIIESSTRGMYFYSLDENGRLILSGSNPAADKIVGINHQLLVGKTIEEAFPNLANTDIPNVYKKIAAGQSGPVQFDIEYTDDQINGFYNVHVFQTEKNSITVNFTDITDRKKIELLLEKQSKELLKANATKDKFFSIIAHDLKSPFNAIMGFSDLMLQNYNDLDDETFLKGLKTIESASNHALKLVENLLLWSKNQTTGKEFSPELLNLNELINESLILAESAVLNKKIRVNFNEKKDVQIVADKNMIELVLRNLISNAIKFTNKKGRIDIHIKEQNQEIQISIADNGIGIPENRLGTIFEISKNKNTPGTENEQGTGLGLILCKDFIENHGGKIWVESIIGKGSTFTVSLPVN